MSDQLLPLPGPQDQSIPACMVLVDLVGSTRMAQALSLGSYMTLMQEFVQVMILIMEARGGQVLQHQGDAVLAWWPAAQAAQACEAAQEAHERASRLAVATYLGQTLRLRAGISSGPVLMGPVGGQLSAYGLPVNYARRLCDAAATGQTLICEDVRRTAPHLPVQSCPPLALAGFGPSCTAYQLRGTHIDARMKVD
ncbi:adenylate/guanylate cyclase domain-containing protein [Deinococcus radiotolerans]|uniref:Guanylate cyclase domain-containing protein n=1 Tax=Deinococcus radiotolerans TaxID=1309407 RepID=A0ABQ2FQM9_9DEIO|nr:adenylate/guanylate cyclase domain-containing protein [Deinococcus radiotolerans]GGL17423.1 hypothetical protein GCM10010844_40330 [Deinococcus radiotolerans]